MRTRPGPRAPRSRPNRKTTTRSYSRTTRMALMASAARATPIAIRRIVVLISSLLVGTTTLRPREPDDERELPQSAADSYGSDAPGAGAAAGHAPEQDRAQRDVAPRAADERSRPADRAESAGRMG